MLEGLEKCGARLCWSAPRRIGPPPCRVGPPTRRGTSPKAPKHPKRAQNEHAMSHWEPAMTRWASNTTWLEFQGTESPQKGAKRARHVVLGVRHVALGLQHDVARAQRRRTAPKGGKKKRATSHWVHAMSRWTSNATWLPNFRLHHTETGTDKRWRNHFGSRRGGLCGVGGNI